MTSMKDISKVCGVSVATVSKALNDHRDIGEKTKQHIYKRRNFSNSCLCIFVFTEL